METQNEQKISMSRIGEAAPEFKAITTPGDINFPSDSTENRSGKIHER